MKNLLIFSLLILSPFMAQAQQKPTKTNIIYLMLDEWGYFESSHMGNKYLITPNIDKMAKEGLRFTQALAGAPVCGPTRCVLLTGLHSAHTSMRNNGGLAPIRAEEKTLATILKTKGYVCGGFGKWGIGARGTSGVPEKHGVDVFFGYYDQVHAHTFYPQYLIRNSEEVPLKGNEGKSFYEGETHAQDEIFKESIKFIKENKDNPFFCYLPWTPPHGLWGIKKDDPSWQLFKDKPWKAGQRTDQDAKVYAAFMHMVDRQIGEIQNLLKELKIDDNTLMIICGDNGGQDYFKTADHPDGWFAPNRSPQTGKRYRAGKGSLYEGGLRIPMIARWPGKIKPDTVSDHLCYFPDIMPTLAALTGAECPKTDGLSILPTLTGKGVQQQHKYLYWEYGNQIAVRYKNWKGYKKGKGKWELYDLNTDIEENNSLAAKNPDIMNKIISLAKEAHEDIKPGEIYDKALAHKDYQQAPHKRKKK
jgi:arylsulfatase A